MAKIRFPISGGFPNIPEDTYKLQIQKPELAYAKGSGMPQIQCRLVVTEGENDGVEIPHQYSLQENILWRLGNDMRILGLMDEFPEGEPFEIEDTEIVERLDGAQGYGYIFTDTYRGTPRSKLSRFLTEEEALLERGKKKETEKAKGYHKARKEEPLEPF